MKRMYCRVDLYGLACANQTRSWSRQCWRDARTQRDFVAIRRDGLRPSLHARKRDVKISSHHQDEEQKETPPYLPSFTLVQKRYCKQQTAVSVVGKMQHLKFTLVRKTKTKESCPRRLEASVIDGPIQSAFVWGQGIWGWQEIPIAAVSAQAQRTWRD
jgi:hypothetical protein